MSISTTLPFGIGQISITEDLDSYCHRFTGTALPRDDYSAADIFDTVGQDFSVTAAGNTWRLRLESITGEISHGNITPGISGRSTSCRLGAPYADTASYEPAYARPQDYLPSGVYWDAESTYLYDDFAMDAATPADAAAGLAKLFGAVVGCTNDGERIHVRPRFPGSPRNVNGTPIPESLITSVSIQHQPPQQAFKSVLICEEWKTGPSNDGTSPFHYYHPINHWYDYRAFTIPGSWFWGPYDIGTNESVGCGPWTPYKTFGGSISGRRFTHGDTGGIHPPIVSPVYYDSAAARARAKAILWQSDILGTAAVSLVPGSGSIYHPGEIVALSWPMRITGQITSVTTNVRIADISQTLTIEVYRAK